MKTCKLFLFVVLYAFSANLGAQLQNTSYSKFGYIDALNFTSHCNSDAAGRVEQSIINGTLTAYRDAELKNPLTVDEYQNLIAVKETWGTIISNPDDPYTLIDTAIVSIAGARNFSFAGKTSVAILCGSGAKVFVNAEHFEKLLDKRLVAVMEYLGNKGLITFSDSVLTVFWKAEIAQLGKQLYLYGLHGEVKPYCNDSLKTTYTADELKERVLQHDVVQLPNPANPTDKYDVVDSFIVREFTADSIDKLGLLFEWETAGFETNAKFIAIAPLFKPVISGVHLPPTPIFWIAKEEYLKNMSPAEKAFWSYFYSYLLQNRSANNEYDIYDENYLPWE